MSIIKNNEFRFECQKCGTCCSNKIKGYTYIEIDQIYELSQQLKITLRDFLKNYIELKNEKITLDNTEVTFTIFVLKQDNGTCVFLQNKKCKIHKNKPFQCKIYPFFDEIFNNEDNFEKVSSTCKGIGKGQKYEDKEIKEKLDQNYSFYRNLYQDSNFIHSLKLDDIINELKIKLKKEGQEIEELALEEIKKELLYHAIDKYLKEKSNF